MSRKKFNKRKFEKLVSAKSPRLQFSQGYGYLLPIQHIIAGFALDWTHDGGYIWQYNLPLLDGPQFFHFGFGQRLLDTEGSIFLPFDTEEIVASQFVDIVECYFSDTELLNEPSRFLDKALTMHNASNPLLHRALIAVQLYLGDIAAIDYGLYDLINEAFGSQLLPEAEVFADEVRESLRYGSTSELLKSWEHKAVQALGLRL